MPSSPSLRWSSIRILAAMAIFIAVFLLHDNGMSSSINTETETKVSPRSSSADDVTYPSLSSGVGLVTTDGAWGKKEDDIHGNDHSGSDIKILGFTDKNYLPMAKLWYGRLSVLGYTEHYIVAHDEISYDNLRSENYRVLPCIIEYPMHDRPVLGLTQQIFTARLYFALEQLRNGTHLLITDVDNVFSRHVPLHGFVDEGYDVYHAYEMWYPTDIASKFGFVICGCHYFLRSSPEAIRFMELVIKKCGWKCDDQVAYNRVFFYDLNVTWDGGIDTPNHVGALRINAPDTENDQLLVESVTGRSSVTNHTIKIWDRDFTWRLAGSIPDLCPSQNNWVGMPTKLDDALIGPGDKVHRKMAAFHIWDKYCILKENEMVGE